MNTIILAEITALLPKSPFSCLSLTNTINHPCQNPLNLCSSLQIKSLNTHLSQISLSLALTEQLRLDFNFDFDLIEQLSQAAGQIGEVKRVAKETNIAVKINLDGTGVTDSSSRIPFLDHMLDQFASHALFDVHLRAIRDVHDHPTNEDLALAIGTVLL